MPGPASASSESAGQEHAASDDGTSETGAAEASATAAGTTAAGATATGATATGTEAPNAAVPAPPAGPSRRITVIPTSEVVVDGEVVGHTPLALPVPEEGSVEVEIRRVGYRTMVREISLDDPENIELRLEPEPEPAPTPARTPRRRRPRRETKTLPPLAPY